MALTGLLSIPVHADGGWPKGVSVVKIEKGKTVSVEGELEAGSAIADLGFASKSSVACFPATQNEKFRGHRVFFATELPPHLELQDPVSGAGIQRLVSEVSLSVSVSEPRAENVP